VALNYCRGFRELFEEYKNVTEKVLSLIESVLHNVKQLQHASFYFVVSGLKIVDHGNAENNIESHSV
jgi:hypothetical protein